LPLVPYRVWEACLEPPALLVSDPASEKSQM